MVPDILRAAGWQLVTLTEHYGKPADEKIPDPEWLKLAGAKGWVALTKDEGIRHKRENRSALIKHGVRCFCVTNQRISGEETAARFLDNRERIVQACRQPGPFFYAVSLNKIERRRL